MTKDAVATMGQKLDDDVGGRDAVHVAVISAMLEDEDDCLRAGQEVFLYRTDENGDAIVGSKARPNCRSIGIVDPFLPYVVYGNDRFWVFLQPRTITGLAHHWQHPAFDDTTNNLYFPPNQTLESENWLRAFCETNDCPDYDSVMLKASLVADGRNDAWDDDFLHFDGKDAHAPIPPEFWDHVEKVLGRKIQGRRCRYFSCSC